ncbi:uncharacterized protein METZ01_LOCUS492920, partial [marine metagenome]
QDGLVTVDVPADLAKDVGSNGNLASNKFYFNYDKTKPTVTISSDSGSYIESGPIPIQVKFNEVVTGFNSSGVSVTNGTFSAITGSDTLYSLSISPTQYGNVIVKILADAATDSAGNTSTVSNQLNIFYSTPSFVDPFNNLDRWKNTSGSQEAWIIDTYGYSGNSARSNVSGIGVGDTLKATFGLASDGKMSFYGKKSGTTELKFTLDGTVKATITSENWSKQTFNLDAGTHDFMFST